MNCHICKSIMLDPLVTYGNDDKEKDKPIAIKYRCDKCKCWWSHLTVHNVGYGDGEEVAVFFDDGSTYNFLPLSHKKDEPSSKE